MVTLSMTGFGAAENRAGQVHLSVEVRSVNNRFLDISFKLPGSYYRFEQDLAGVVKDCVKRGRVEVFVTRKDMGAQDYDLVFNRGLFAKYLKIGRQVVAAAGPADDRLIGELVCDVLRRREVLELVPKDADVGREYRALEKALRQALAGLVRMRSKEGKALENEINRQLKLLRKFVKEISQFAKEAPHELRRRFEARLARIAHSVEIDEGRLAAEVALLADRVDVTEELVRLDSHCLQFKQAIAEGGGGRKFEFLLQEIGRELNTIGSKAQKSEVTALVVEAKAVAEKMREQVQNIE